MATRVTTMTNEQARRMALAAQGFARSRPKGKVDRRHFRRVFSDIGLLQLDSVNVISRSHYLPVFARIGGYSRDALDTFTTDGTEVFEYWGHEASLLPVQVYPLFRHRMDGMTPWRGVRRMEEEHPGYLDAVYEEIARHGPLTVSDLNDPGERTGPWWGYGKGKLAVEWLFASGRVTAYRTANFTRVYDLPERVLPGAVLEAEAPSQHEAYRRLLVLAAAHYGVGTARDLADYYRLHVPTARPIVEELAGEGLLRRVEVAGWPKAAFAHPEAVVPRRDSGTALLSPFDPVVWERDRAHRMFDFHYRIEIYVPAPKRIFGYYVLPFLLDGDLVGRVDLKAERTARELHVRGAHIEPGRDAARVATRMAAELHLMAAWIGLDEGVVVHRSGNLARELRRAVG